MATKIFITRCFGTRWTSPTLLLLLVLSGNCPAADQPADGASAQKASLALLRAKWEAFFARPVAEGGAARLNRFADERFLPASRRRDLAREANSPFRAPTESRPVAGVHQLNVEYARNRIGNDDVYLRSYNGELVGPTIRVRPGDSLRVRLTNNLPDESPHTGDHNELHGFNTTNLHTHGLHVSPRGNSDNVLLRIEPGQVQEYQIDVPADHASGTFWYHAHKHGAVAAQVSSGMAGALIVEGGLDTVAEIAAARERIMVLQQIPYFNDGLPEGVIELEYAGQLFGPGDWDTLGRFTTVNGIQLPVLRMRPGEVERWRLIHSGFRERIELKLDRAAGSGPSTLPLHEIAVDGLALGKIVQQEQLELWPGYRSDVLVKAPDVPGEYLIVDERVEAGGGLNGSAEERKYIGRLVIEGAARPMRLPDPADLAPFRLPSVSDSELTGTRSVTYGINVRNGQVHFEIDGKSYDPAEPRVLTLGDVEEWTATSVNSVGPVPHPFHIHVNPFEIVRIEDASGRNLLRHGPVWRDTIILRPGQNVIFRTRYERFTGDFVQHCHILDHEDQGMMELVRIVARRPLPGGGSSPSLAKAVRNAKLLDSRRRTRRLTEFLGKPTILLFNRGSGCPHCRDQMKDFAEAFDGEDLHLVGISSELEPANNKSPITLLSDPDHQVFRSFGAFRDGPLHGVFVLDERGAVRWHTTGDLPFSDVAEVRRRLPAPKTRTPTTEAAAPLKRKNIQELSPQELAAYEHALEILRDSTDPENNYLFHADLHNEFSTSPPHGCEHGNELFLPWHRYHLYYFEKALQETDPDHPTLSTRNVTIPYWDWSREHTGDRYPSPFEVAGSVLHHDFRKTTSSSPMFSAAYLNDLIVDNPDWHDYAGGPIGGGTSYGALESPSHNDMHSVYIGGDMGDPDTAAYDPIYWSFHAFIDLQWARWQAVHQKEPTCQSCVLRGFPTRADRLTPIVKSTIDTAAMGYVYEFPPDDESNKLAEKLAGRDRNLNPRRLQLQSVMRAADRTVAVWGGPGPFRFHFPVPERDFTSAVISFTGVTVPQSLSYEAELYAHPPEMALRPRSDAFRTAYRLGRIALWKGHAGHHHGRASLRESVTSRLKAVSRAHGGEDWILSIVVKPAPTFRTSVPTRQPKRPLSEEVQFRDIYLLLDGAAAERDSD